MACGAGAARDARVDDLDRCTERALEAHVAGRGALAVTLYTRAENLATQLHPDDTCLIPAWLRCYRALSLLQQAALANLAAGGTPAREDASAQDVAALRVQAGDLLQGVVTVIERRTTAGTTKYGTCRKEEVAFHRRWLDALRRAHNLPPLAVKSLDTLSPAVGYVLTLSLATSYFSYLLSPVPLAGSERRVEALVFSTIDSMMDIARTLPGCRFLEEKRWVSVIETLLLMQQYSQIFTALRARWTAAPFQAMLRARGLSNAIAEIDAHAEKADALRTTDVAAHGLHPCGLPSCDQHEVTVKQFKYCGDCEEEWYCCAEHQVLHWTEHKPTCRARTAAAAAATTVE